MNHRLQPIDQAISNTLRRHGVSHCASEEIRRVLRDYLADEPKEIPRPVSHIELHESPRGDIIAMLATFLESNDHLPLPEPFSAKLVIPQGHASIHVGLDSASDFELVQGSRCTTITRQEIADHLSTVEYTRILSAYKDSKRESESLGAELYHFLHQRIEPYLAAGNYREAMLYVVGLKLVNCDPTRRVVAHIFEKALSEGADGYAQLLDIDIAVAQTSL